MESYSHLKSVDPQSSIDQVVECTPLKFPSTEEVGGKSGRFYPLKKVKKIDIFPPSYPSKEKKRNSHYVKMRNKILPPSISEKEKKEKYFNKLINRNRDPEEPHYKIRFITPYFFGSDSLESPKMVIYEDPRFQPGYLRGELDKRLREIRQVEDRSFKISSRSSEGGYKWWLDEELYAEEKKEFISYIYEISTKVLLFRENNTQEPLIIPYKSRFSKESLKKAFFELKNLRFPYSIHCSLTLDPNLSNNIIEHCDKLTEYFNNFRRRLDRYLKTDHITFARGLEFGKDHNMPHLHFVIALLKSQKLTNYQFKKLEDWIINEWTNNGELADKKAQKIVEYENLYIYQYLKKYFSKVFNDLNVITAPNSPAYLYWITNKHIYSLSQDLLDSNSKEVSRFKQAFYEFGLFIKHLGEGIPYNGFKFVGSFNLEDLYAYSSSSKGDGG